MTGCVLATMMAGIIMVIVGLHGWGTLHQIHSVSGDGRVHGRHCRHHLGQPAQGPAGPRRRQGAGGPDIRSWLSCGRPSGHCGHAPSAVGAGDRFILGLRRLRPHWPGMLIAVAVCAALTGLLHLDVATIGTRFGGVPRSLPAPALPTFDLAKMRRPVPGRSCHRAPGLDRIPAVGRCRRRHERATASLEL